MTENTLNVLRGPVEKGSILVALPSLVDPNFRQSVVLLCAVDPEGCMGLVLNRPSRTQLRDVLPDADLIGQDVPVFDGGPVGIDTLLILCRGEAAGPDFSALFDDISLGGTLNALKEAATTAGISGDYRPYRGYAGWGGGQLETEIEQGAWAVLPGDGTVVFHPKPQLAWSEAMAHLGGPLAIYATMPPDLRCN